MCALISVKMGPLSHPLVRAMHHRFHWRILLGCCAVGKCRPPKDCAGHGKCTGGIASATPRAGQTVHSVCALLKDLVIALVMEFARLCLTQHTTLCLQGAVPWCYLLRRYCSPRDCNGHGACNRLCKCDCDPGFGGAGWEKTHLRRKLHKSWIV